MTWSRDSCGGPCWRPWPWTASPTSWSSARTPRSSASRSDAGGPDAAPAIQGPERRLDRGVVPMWSPAVRTAILVVPVDLPFVTPEAIDALAEPLLAGEPTVVLVTDRHGTGTNALGLRPAGRHRLRVRAGQPSGSSRSRPAPPGLATSSSRVPSPSTSTRPRTWSSSSRPLRSGWVSAESSIQVVALDGIPEIRLGRRSGRRSSGTPSQRTPGALPLRDDDVLVVTQKVVSKAEGAVVDLTTVGPATRGGRVRPDAAIATRARSRSSCARPGASSGWRTASSSPRRRTGSSARTAASTPRTSAPIRAPSSRSCRVTRMPRRAHPGRDPGALRTSTCPSSCRTRSDGHGAGASSTSRSASPGCCRSRTCAACRTPMAGSCDRPSGPSPTSSPRRPSSPSARPPARPAAIVRGAAFTRGEGSIRDLVMPAENDLFR